MRTEWRRVRELVDSVVPMDDGLWEDLAALLNVDPRDTRGLVPVCETVARCEEYTEVFSRFIPIDELRKACKAAGTIADILTVGGTATERDCWLYDGRRNPTGLLRTNPAYGVYYHEPNYAADTYACLGMWLALAIRRAAETGELIPAYLAGLALRTLAETKHSEQLISIQPIDMADLESLRSGFELIREHIPHARSFIAVLDFLLTGTVQEARTRTGSGGPGGPSRGPGRRRIELKLTPPEPDGDICVVGDSVSPYDPPPAPRLKFVRSERRFYSRADAARAIKAAQNRNIRANHLLCQDIEVLTPYQVAILTEEVKKAADTDLRWAALDFGIALFTGVPVAQVDGLARFGATEHCNLNLEAETVRRAAPFAPIQQAPSNPERYRPIKADIVAPIPKFLADRIWCTREHSNRKLHSDAHVCDFIRVVSESPYLKNVTAHTVEAYWAGQVAKATGRPTVAALLTGHLLPGVEPDLHYLHISEASLVEYHRRTWDNLVARVNAELACIGLEAVADEMSIGAAVDSTAGFGSRYVPLEAEVQTRIGALRILPALPQVDSPREYARTVLDGAIELIMHLTGGRPNYALLDVLTSGIPVFDDKPMHGAGLRDVATPQRAIDACVRRVDEAKEAFRIYWRRITRDAVCPVEQIHARLMRMAKPGSAVREIDGARLVPNYARQMYWTSLSEAGVPDWMLRANIGHVPGGTNVLDSYSAVDGRKLRRDLETMVRSLDHLRAIFDD